MKNILLLFALILSFQVCLSQTRHKTQQKKFAKVAIGPEIGTTITMAYLKSQEGDFYFEYYMGGKLILRPIRFLGVESGFLYHKAIKHYDYYSSPLIFKFYNKSGNVFAIGPEFYFDTRGDKVDFKNPEVGARIGAGTEGAQLYLLFNPKLPILEPSKINNVQFFVGINLSISLLLQVV